jgi:hypothetical protein
MGLQEILQDYVNKDYQELVSLAAQSFDVLYPAFVEAFGKDDATLMVASFMASSLSADGSLSQRETQFICDLLGADASFAQNLYNLDGQGQASDLADKIFDSVPEQFKSHLLNLCLCFLACDETISRTEVAFIVRLLEQ